MFRPRHAIAGCTRGVSMNRDPSKLLTWAIIAFRSIWYQSPISGSVVATGSDHMHLGFRLSVQD